MKTLDLGWLAGIIEGEGWIGFNTTKSIHRCPCVEVGMVDKDVIARVAGLFGKKVLGPYGPYTTNRQAHYQAQVYGKDAVRVLKLILPHLGKRRTKAAKKMLKWWESR